MRSEQVASRASSVLGPSTGIGLPVPLRQNPSLDSTSNLKAVLFPKQKTCHVFHSALLSSFASNPVCYAFKLSDRPYLIYSSVRVPVCVCEGGGVRACVHACARACVCVIERDRDRESN